MKANFYGDHLIEQFRFCRGRIESNVELSKSTWFKVGGPAEVMFWPADLDDLIDFLQNQYISNKITAPAWGKKSSAQNTPLKNVMLKYSLNM